MSTNLSDICIYNAKLDGKGFVGLVFENGDLKVYFPLGYRRADNDRERRRDILNLLSVLESFMEKDTSSEIPKKTIKANSDKGFPIQAYLRIISDFFSHGYYHETETQYHMNLSGKIYWRKTIKAVHPEFIGNNLIFLNYVTRKSLNNENALITQIHKYFVHDAFFKIGFLFSSFVPVEPQIKYNSQLFRSVINLKLSKTFNDRNMILFNDMITIMDYKDSSDSTNNDYRYGTEEFEYVWERLVDYVYGVPNKQDYYPHTEWHIGDSVLDDKDVDYKKNTLRPDTILLVEDDVKKEVFVLDSKYYKYGESRNPSSLPGTDSIIKQIAYGQYVENNIEHPELIVKGENIFNAFILPFDSQSRNLPEVFGYAQATYVNNDKPYHKIYGVKLDVRDLMYHHTYHDNAKILELADTIRDYAKVN